MNANFQRLRFLGASTFSGRQGYLAPQHQAFHVDGPILDLRLSTSGTQMGPFEAAPVGAVILPALSSTWSGSWTRSHNPTSMAISAHMARFDTYVRSAAVSDLPVLQSVTPECGFFTADIYDPIYHGSVLATDSIPAASRISQSFSVFSFLRMQPGADHDSTLPADGWADPAAAQRFVSALQWFLTDLFGPRIGRVTILYRALGYLRSHLESVHLANAWSSINSRVFSAVILTHIHSLWVMLLQWEEGSTKIPVYYRSDNSILQIDAASPFVQSDTSVSLDSVLTNWLHTLDRRFPPGLLQLANSFRDIIPTAWDHIFTSEPSGDDASAQHGRTLSRSGDPNRETSRSWLYNVFEKVPAHADSRRSRNRQCIEAIRPFPKLPNARGELVEICFGATCRGLRCLNPDNCRKIHMFARPQLRDEPREKLRQVREWLQIPAVRARIRLTDIARGFPNLR